MLSKANVSESEFISEEKAMEMINSFVCIELDTKPVKEFLMN